MKGAGAGGAGAGVFSTAQALHTTLARCGGGGAALRRSSKAFISEEMMSPPKALSAGGTLRHGASARNMDD